MHEGLHYLLLVFHCFGCRAELILWKDLHFHSVKAFMSTSSSKEYILLFNWGNYRRGPHFNCNNSAQFYSRIHLHLTSSATHPQLGVNLYIIHNNSKQTPEFRFSSMMTSTLLVADQANIVKIIMFRSSKSAFT